MMTRPLRVSTHTLTQGEAGMREAIKEWHCCVIHIEEAF